MLAYVRKDTSQYSFIFTAQVNIRTCFSVNKEDHLTQELTVAVVDGEVPQGSRHCPNNTIVIMGEQFCHDGEALFQTHHGSDVPTKLDTHTHTIIIC